MPVSGLVLTLSDDQARRDAALAALGENPSLSLGVLLHQRLPVAMDTINSEMDKELWNWISSLPGVLFIDLVCADFSTDGPAERPPISRKALP
jgi:nitrate reductase NapAB chaperone NapD